MKPTRSAFSALELLIVVATICLMAAAFLPYLAHDHSTGCRMNCVNNLKQIGLSFRTWASDNNDKLPMEVSITNGGSMELISSGYVFPHFQVLSIELSTPRILICPEEPDSWRLTATTFAYPIPVGAVSVIPFTNDNNVSYFVGLDATDINPTAILTGDHWLNIDGRSARHGTLTITSKSRVRWSASPPAHNGNGNIGLADGSVQQATSTYLQRLFANVGTNTMRLAFP
jgi:prepilin-type processing-associated H-X9-DG protein